MRELLKQPIILKSDVFVEFSKTPWGGRVIGEYIKNEIVEGVIGEPIGESWEFSISDSEYGSIDSKTNVALAEFFEHTDLIYGDSLAKNMSLNNDDSELLIKIIDTDQRLSFQVHPDESFAGLIGDECGKSEAWLILDSKAGGGVYLGFIPEVNSADIKERLKHGQDIEHYLNFVEVERYDFVQVPPGTPHAIGAGLTLIEPQLIKKSKKGKTFRLSDWGRKYDDNGKLCETGGSLRELHVDRASSLLNPAKQSGVDFLSGLLIKPQREVLKHGLDLLVYEKGAACNLKILLGEESYKVSLIVEKGFLVLMALKGCVSISAADGSLKSLKKGQTAFIANAIRRVNISSEFASELAIFSPFESEYQLKV